MKSWKIQKFFGDVVYDLRSRGLLPLAVLLVVAMVAVPILILRAARARARRRRPSWRPKTAADLAPENQAAVLAYDPGVRDYRERLDELPPRTPSSSSSSASPVVAAADATPPPARRRRRLAAPAGGGGGTATATGGLGRGLQAPRATSSTRPTSRSAPPTASCSGATGSTSSPSCPSREGPGAGLPRQRRRRRAATRRLPGRRGRDPVAAAGTASPRRTPARCWR